jgi:isopentenyl-diphosphate Delta-isomerase
MAADELFDVLDEDGNVTGRTATKREVHENGWWHTGAHLCAIDGNGNIFQQLRGKIPDVRILPNVWDLFIVAGHVSAGETPVQTLVRETQEEIGLDFSLADLFLRGLEKVCVTRSDYWVEDPSYPKGGYYHRVFDHSFIMTLKVEPEEFRLEPKKVLGVRAYPLSRMRWDLNQPYKSKAYQGHAHRAPEDSKLYAAILSRAEVLSLSRR